MVLSRAAVLLFVCCLPLSFAGEALAEPWEGEVVEDDRPGLERQQRASRAAAVPPEMLDASQEEPEDSEVEVGPGDSLGTLADAYDDVSWRDLWDANTDLEHPDVLRVGMTLSIPADPDDINGRPLPGPSPSAGGSSQGSTTTSGREEPSGSGSSPSPPSGGEWGRISACIREIESGGDYGAVNPSGRYRGAYQFDAQTWASVGGSGDPAAASPAEQDRRARILWEQRGLQPWPTPNQRCR